MTRNRRAPRIVMLLENRVYPKDVRVRPHAEALAAAGYEVTVISPKGLKSPWRETINGVRAYHFPLIYARKRVMAYLLEFAAGTLFLTLMMLWVWMRHGMDVLVLYNPPDTLFAAGLLPRLLGKKVVYDYRDPAPELYLTKVRRASKLLYSTLVFLEGIASRLAHHIIIVNGSLRRQLVERHHLDPKKLTIVRQGPDLEAVRLSAPDPSLLPRQADTIIGYLGNMSAQDGLDHLFLALKYLDEQFGHKDWLCVLIGPADDPDGLREMIVRYGIEDRVWFAGYLMQEEWVRLLSQADICVEPCPASTMNLICTMNKIMDYMALAKPVVAYDMPEHHITAGESALYAQQDDITDFARQIARLIEEPRLRGQLGRAGRMRIEHSLALQHQRKLLLQTYAWLAPIDRAVLEDLERAPKKPAPAGAGYLSGRDEGQGTDRPSYGGR